MNGEGLLVYAFRIRGDPEVYYLGILIDSAKGGSYGRIHTSFPITKDRNLRLYNDCCNYFKVNDKYIMNDVIITNVKY